MHLFTSALDFEHQLAGAIAQYGAFVYLALATVVFVEIAILPLFFLPGDPLIFVCGSFCATGALDPWTLGPVLIAASFAGSAVSFWTGRRMGTYVSTAPWVHQRGLERTRHFYQTYGSLTLLISPYIAVVRTFAPFVAGVAAMPPRRFAGSAALGSCLWIIGLLSAGYFLGNVPFVHRHLGLIVIAGTVLAIAAIALTSAVKRLRS